MLVSGTMVVVWLATLATAFLGGRGDWGRGVIAGVLTIMVGIVIVAVSSLAYHRANTHLVRFKAFMALE